MDVLPTLAKLAGAELPSDRLIDGHDAWALWSAQPEARSPYEAFYYYWDYGLEAVRSGPWKLHFPHRYRSLKDRGGTDGQPADYVQRETGLALYNLDADVGETHDVAAQHPEQVRRLTELAEHARRTLGDSLQKRQGEQVRPAGRK
jgi:arylsulfatase A-like enzyme